MQKLDILMLNTVGLPLNGNSLKEGSIGGSETAFLSMAKEFATLGHKVTAYAPCESNIGFGLNGAEIRPLPVFPQDNSGYDIGIYSRDLSYPVFKAPNTKHSVLWLHDAPASVKDFNYQIGSMWTIDEIFCLSEYHKDCYTQHADYLEPFITVTRNGVDNTLIMTTPGKPRKGNNLLYMSRTERGLPNLIFNLFPAMLKKNPALQLLACTYYTPDQMVPDWLKGMRKQCDDAFQKSSNMHWVGNLNKRKLYELIKSVDVVVYPCELPEISCIGAMEAQACGTPIITSRRYALPETLSLDYPGLVDGDPGTPEYLESFVKKTFQALENPSLFIDHGYANFHKQRFEWSEIAKDWTEHFTNQLKGKGYFISNEPTPIKNLGRNLDTVTLCMIVKNEEDNILGSLKTSVPYVHEVCILDTGSTDSTKEIATNYLKTQTHLKTWTYWNHDFSSDFAFDAARNESISKATSDWVLVLDADERLTGGEYIQRFLRSIIIPGFVIRQFQFHIDRPDDFDSPVRLYRNWDIKLPLVKDSFKYISYNGVIHEHPVISQNEPIRPASTLQDINIGHYGYLSEKIRRGKARDRNLALLLKDRQKNPGRLLGIVLVMRDFIHMFEWDLEKNTLSPNYLEKVINNWKTHFADLATTWANGIVIEEGFKRYQEAVKYVAKYKVLLKSQEVPFCTRIFMSASIGEEPENPTSSETRWFLNQSEFKEYMEDLSEKVCKTINPPK